jgi:alpha-1,3-mannosyltransferase
MIFQVEESASTHVSLSGPKVRVLQVTPTFHPEIGGIATVVDELTSQLGPHRIDSEVAHISVAHRKLREELLAGKRVWRVPMLGNRLVGLAPQLRDVVKGFDLIHVHDPQLAALTANVVFFGGGIPAVLSTHGGYHHTKRLAYWKRAHEKLLLRSALNTYTMILASSSADHSRFSQFSRRVVLCPNGVNVDRFRLSQKKSRCANRWIYWGRLSRNKRLDRVIACVAQARRIGYDVNLCICGPDFDGISDELTRQIAVEGLSEFVELKPFLSIDALREELTDRTVFITASEHEGFGLSIVEAMAAGCLIVCRDMEPLNGFVQERKNGIFLRFDGKSDDESRLTQLLQLDEAAVAQGANVSQSQAGSYGWQSAITAFIDSYRNALATSRG